MSNLLQNSNFEIKSVVIKTQAQKSNQRVSIGVDKSSIMQFEYNEGIYNKFLKVTLQIADTTNSISDNLFGMEEVEIIVKDLMHGITYEFTNGSQNGPLYVYQIHSRKVIDTGKIFVLELCRKDAIISMQKQVCKKYTSITADQLAGDILSTELQTKKQINTTRSQNGLTFIPPNSRPYDILVWARSKYFDDSQHSTSSKGKYSSAGYLFWETYLSYNFKSVDEVCSQSSKPQTYTTGTGIGGLDEAYKVQNVQMPQSLDMISNFDRGFYSGTVEYFDLVNCEVKTSPYNLKDNYNKWKKLGTNDNLPQLNSDVFSMEEPTRTMVVVYNDDLFLESKKDQTKNKMKFVETVTQSIQRMGVFTGQVLEGTVLGNMTLNAGNIINVEFQDAIGGIDKNHSGRYIVFELRHIFSRERDQLKTQFVLVRDSFGV
jgi:hypothetical protein